MGKTSRKTKAKNKDFQKVKLKVGKKLPKGLNETSTAFKTGAIQIRDQLRTSKDSSEPTVKNKLSLKDLLSQCGHYSAAVRHDAITSLRQLLTTNPQLLAANLGTIVERTAQICLDKDGNVRQAGSRLFKVIMPHISSNQISPFFPILSAHLCCAMTHITDEIQIDSLSLLDVCLEFYPDLVTSKQSNLLQNFVEQLSRQSQTSKPGKGSAGRSLLINPDSKLSSQKWRVKVLERLYKLLEAVTNQKENSGGSAMHERKGPAEQEGKLIHFSKDSPVEHLILSHDEEFFYRGYTISQHGGVGVGSILTETDQLKKYIEILLPLLLQSWVEAGPAQMNSSLPGNAMDVHALAMLGNVLRVLQLLLKCVQLGEDKANLMQWIRKEYLKDMVTYFLPYFPYSMHESMPQKHGGKHKGKADKNKDVPQVSVVMLNLTVVDIMCHFLDDDSVTASKWFTNLTNYISQMMHNEKLSQDQLKVVLHVLHQLVEISADEDTLADLLDACYSLYSSQNPLSSDKIHISHFFSTLLLSQQATKFIRLQGVRQWLQHLPKLLVQISSQKPQSVDKLLHIMRRVAVLGEKAFSQSLEKYSLKILGEVDGTSSISSWSPESQKMLFELLSWLPEWSSSHFACICQHCHKGTLHPEALQYLLQILLHRYENPSHLTVCHFNTAHFISFLFSLSLGSSHAELKHMQSLSDRNQSTEVIVTPDLVQHWSRHCTITKIVCETLHQFTNSNQLAQLYWVFLQNILDSLKFIPVTSSYGLLHVCLATTAASTQQHHLVEKLATFLSCTLLSLVKLPAITNVESVDVISNVESVTIETIIRLSSHVDILSDACLRAVLQQLKRHKGDDLIALTKVTNRWLSHPSLLPAVQRNKKTIKSTCQQIEESNPTVVDSQIWSDFKYSISIVH